MKTEMMTDYRGMYLDMVATFKHRHVNNGVDDGCKECGRDLRDEVHERSAGAPSPTEFMTTTRQNQLTNTLAHASVNLLTENKHLLAALIAVRARLSGEWDCKALVKCGPLSSSTDADCRAIIEAALTVICPECGCHGGTNDDEMNWIKCGTCKDQGRKLPL